MSGLQTTFLIYAAVNGIAGGKKSGQNRRGHCTVKIAMASKAKSIVHMSHQASVSRSSTVTRRPLARLPESYAGPEATTLFIASSRATFFIKLDNNLVAGNIQLTGTDSNATTGGHVARSALRNDGGNTLRLVDKGAQSRKRQMEKEAYSSGREKSGAKEQKGTRKAGC